jgi:hypothetical protein
VSENQKLKIATYRIDWSDSTLKPTIELARSTVDTTSSSIALVGYDVWNWGELFQENIVHMLEHFAGHVPPNNPTIGQAWFDVVTRQLKSYDGVNWIPTSTAYVGPSQPQGSRNIGDLWYDTDDGPSGSMKFWNGSVWDSVLSKVWATQNFVNKNGDVMVGNLTIVDDAFLNAQTVKLRRDPNALDEAATKRYVDGKFTDQSSYMITSVPAGTVMDPSYWNSGVFGWSATSATDAPAPDMLGLIMSDTLNFTNGGAMLQAGTSWTAVDVGGTMMPSTLKVRVKDPALSAWSGWRELVYLDQLPAMFTNNDKINAPNTGANSTFYPVFADAQGLAVSLKTNTGFNYNATTGALSVNTISVNATPIVDSSLQLRNIHSVDSVTLATLQSVGIGGVTLESSSAVIAMNGVASAGSSATAARADHVHPTDTSRAPIASPALTGIPTAPTAATNTNTTQIATCSFVNSTVNSKLASASAASVFNIMVWG